MGNGVVVGGIKYQFLREEDGKLVLAKRKGSGALTLQSSKTVVVIGHTGEGLSQGNTNKGVAVIAEYLESLNYADVEVGVGGNGWDSYIDNLIGQATDMRGTAHCDKATIISLDTGAKYTSGTRATDLKLLPGEGQTIARVFKNKDFGFFMGNGVVVGGIKYQFLREEDGKLVLAKRKGSGALTLQSSKTVVVIGHTGEGLSQGNTNKGVAVIAEYLESLNYADVEVGVGGNSYPDVFQDVLLFGSVFGIGLLGYYFGQKHAAAKAKSYEILPNDGL